MQGQAAQDLHALVCIRILGEAFLWRSFALTFDNEKVLYTHQKLELECRFAVWFDPTRKERDKPSSSFLQLQLPFLGQVHRQNPTDVR